MIVNIVYGNVENHQGLSLILATIFFGIQIYCDFSGYSDIAIGSARILGIDLMKNFDRPYFSKSISEFWRRWHISLSSWFKDYLYIPLGGNRVSAIRRYLNIFITFLISGLWHGANWTFIIWGALHGIFYVISIATKNIRDKTDEIFKLYHMKFIHESLKLIFTFSLVTFAWIFFRATSLNQANYIVSHLFNGLDNVLSLLYLKNTISALGISKIYFILLLGCILFMEIVEFIKSKGYTLSLKPKIRITVQWAFYYFIIFTILLFGVYGLDEQSQFIYFQF